MLILLPPSEGKAVPDSGDPLDLTTLSFSRLRSPRRQVLSALVTLCRPARPGVAREVLGLSPNQDAEIARNKLLRKSPTLPAGQLYNGVLYEALDLETLSPQAHELARRSILIFSGLWGALRIDDRVPAYRCSIGANLPGIGGLAPYWRKFLGEVIPEVADGPVLDLRSGAYAAAWVPRGEPASRTLTVRVLHERTVDGVLKRTVVSHFNKATKGRLVRDLLVGGVEPGSVGELVTALRDLKYRVEEQETGPGGPRQLDVVVAEL